MMKNDIERLKDEIKIFQKGENMFTEEFNAGVQNALEYVQELLDQLEEPVITYFSPFLKIPFMVETETHKFMVDVTKIINKEETEMNNETCKWTENNVESGWYTECGSWFFIEDISFNNDPEKDVGYCIKCDKKIKVE